MGGRSSSNFVIMWRTLQFVVTWPAGGAALLVNTAAARRGSMEIWKWNCPGSGKWRFVCCHEFYDLTHITYNSCWDVCIFCLSIHLSICPTPFCKFNIHPCFCIILVLVSYDGGRHLTTSYILSQQ